jgi:hypothetical protein
MGRFVEMDAGMTARSTTTATNEFSRLDRARCSLGCRQRPLILIAQLEQSQQDLVIGDRRPGGGGQGWRFGLRFPRAVVGDIQELL